MTKKNPEHAKPPQKRRARKILSKLALSGALATTFVVEATVFGQKSAEQPAQSSGVNAEKSAKDLLAAMRLAKKDTQTLNSGGSVEVKLADGTLVPLSGSKRELPSIIAPIIFYGSVKNGGLIGVQETSASGEAEIKAVEIKPGEFTLVPFGIKQYLHAQVYGNSGKEGQGIYAYNSQSHASISAPDGLPLSPGQVIFEMKRPITVD